MAPRETVDQQASTEVATITDRKLLEKFAEMAVALPSEIDEGTEDILRKVLSATTWQEVDQPWRTSDVDDIVGKELRVTKVTRRPSTFDGGLGIFLIVKLIDPRTEQEYVKTTGSISVVGQFASLYFLGATAITIRWCKSKTPTDRGYWPQHIEIVDAHVPERGSKARSGGTTRTVTQV